MKKLNIIFDKNSIISSGIQELVIEFLNLTDTLEQELEAPIIIFQDGKSGAYYIKINLLGRDASTYCDLNAKLDLDNNEAFRANRELLLSNKTYKKMRDDAELGREFNDIIVEYTTEYESEMPLKVWGGQHRIHAVGEASNAHTRHHGFKVYFALSKDQRTEVALISNTNISVSNDTFDRMVEETIFGDVLRRWCQLVGLFPEDENFPDVGSKSDYITVKLARTFIVNFYEGFELGQTLLPEQLDARTYEPYVATSGINADPRYEEIINKYDILDDENLITAGENFSKLHKIQQKTVADKSTSIANRKSFRNKAFVVSVLCGWSFVSGLLQNHPDRLINHYEIPKTNKLIPDPMNASQMSQYRHDKDAPTYRGLGTRSSTKDRQRIAQLFLAKSKEAGGQIDKNLMKAAVSKVIAIKLLKDSY